MGIFLSCCEDNEEVCQSCSRRGLPLTNNECHYCRTTRISRISSEAPRQRAPNRGKRVYRPPVTARPKPAYVIPKKEPKRVLFGQYRCSCGRQWNSRRSWRDKYQACKSCGKATQAHTQRELRAEDIKEERSLGEAMRDHPMNLCQMCKELGYYCGKYK